MADNDPGDLLAHYGGPIKQYLDDPTVTEICVERWNQVRVERGGALQLTDATWRDEKELVQYIKLVANGLGQPVDEEDQPILDARLKSGARINAVLTPCAVFGATISIRPFPKTIFTLEDLLRFGSVTPNMVEIFGLAIQARLNILISGGTGSGKTALIRAICQLIDPLERVLTVEDTAENLLPGHRHVEAFEAPKRRARVGAMEVTMGQLIVTTLRRRPDRLVIGEIRTPEAAGAFIDAINTGHDGTITTIHANSAMDAMPRVETRYAQLLSNFSMEVVRELVRSNLNLIVHAVREPNDDGLPARRVKEILWIDDGKPRYLIRHIRGQGFVSDDTVLADFKSHL
ncbi:MAG TPA: ATPase, T2SS/T4P/T4SS family [Rhizomicrobium sp.]|nr:ATPase, T2SS/T4P/T4SS family [Rhizomicrobium sp.]